jgi:hypothetical protein
MSIGSIGSPAFSYSSTPLPIDAQPERRAGSPDPSVMSYLTAGDRELISVMFGPSALATGFDPHGQPVKVPDFAAILIGDRKSGTLPIGVEVTSPYLQSIWDASPAARGANSGPLTRKNLVDGLAFLGRRSQGATVDVRA